MNYTSQERIDLFNSNGWSKNDVRLLIRDCDVYERAIRKLLNKVNRVTSAHRHGHKIQQRDLDALSNRQVEIETMIKDNE